MRPNFLLVLLLLIIASVSLKAQVSGSFLQDVRTEIQLPVEAGKNVIKLFSSNQSVTAVTSNGVFRFKNDIWSGKSTGSNWRTATVDGLGNIWLASSGIIQRENSDKKFTLSESAKKIGRASCRERV